MHTSIAVKLIGSAPHVVALQVLFETHSYAPPICSVTAYSVARVRVAYAL